MKSKILLGLFSDRDDAENAILELQDNGYDAKDISIMMRDTGEAGEVSKNTGVKVADGTVKGATTGTVIGAIAGLLTGVGAIAIPGVGPFLAAGPLATALGLTGAAATTVSGAATGALAGGLIGALTSFGLSRSEAEEYESGIKSGAILVAVSADREPAEARAILEDNNAENIRMLSPEGPSHKRSYGHHAHRHATM